MKPFMDKDFLLYNDTAKTLFHSFAEKMPIFDWHCHLSPKEIYENRKSQLELRIKSMIEYAESKNTCRSEMLLRYFGEEKIHPCGHCDVCLEKKKKPKSIKCFNEASKKILEILKDKKPHQLTELLQGQEKDVIEQAIRILIQEEVISQIGNLFYLK